MAALFFERVDCVYIVPTIPPCIPPECQLTVNHYICQYRVETGPSLFIVLTKLRVTVSTILSRVNTTTGRSSVTYQSRVLTESYVVLFTISAYHSSTYGSTCCAGYRDRVWYSIGRKIEYDPMLTVPTILVTVVQQVYRPRL